MRNEHSAETFSYDLFSVVVWMFFSSSPIFARDVWHWVWVVFGCSETAGWRHWQNEFMMSSNGCQIIRSKWLAFSSLCVMAISVAVGSSAGRMKVKCNLMFWLIEWVGKLKNCRWTRFLIVMLSKFGRVGEVWESRSATDLVWVFEFNEPPKYMTQLFLWFKKQHSIQNKIIWEWHFYQLMAVMNTSSNQPFAQATTNQSRKICF